MPATLAQRAAGIFLRPGVSGVRVNHKWEGAAGGEKASAIGCAAIHACGAEVAAGEQQMRSRPSLLAWYMA
jgi:hypothetical protein